MNKLNPKNWSNETYDTVQYYVRIVLPAFVTLLITLSKTLDIPVLATVAGVVSAVHLFFGSCLKVSSDNYVPEGGKDNG